MKEVSENGTTGVETLFAAALFRGVIELAGKRVLINTGWLKCCFTSTETVGFSIRDGSPAGTATSTFTQLLISVNTSRRRHAFVPPCINGRSFLSPGDTLVCSPEEEEEEEEEEAHLLYLQITLPGDLDLKSKMADEVELHVLACRLTY